jgi:hypothetical protein
MSNDVSTLTRGTLFRLTWRRRSLIPSTDSCVATAFAVRAVCTACPIPSHWPPAPAASVICCCLPCRVHSYRSQRDRRRPVRHSSTGRPAIPSDGMARTARPHRGAGATPLAMDGHSVPPTQCRLVSLALSAPTVLQAAVPARSALSMPLCRRRPLNRFGLANIAPEVCRRAAKMSAAFGARLVTPTVAPCHCGWHSERNF